MSNKPYEQLTFTATEKEQDIFLERIQIEQEFYSRCQPVYSTPQICVTCCDIDLIKTSRIIQHTGGLRSY